MPDSYKIDPEIDGLFIDYMSLPGVEKNAFFARV
jgi:hypothetical protein